MKFILRCSERYMSLHPRMHMDGIRTVGMYSYYYTSMLFLVDVWTIMLYCFWVLYSFTLQCDNTHDYRSM